MEKRICANPLCGLEFETTNPKKMFHNNSCKNKAAYHYKQTEYPWEVMMQKARNRNIQVLEYLYNKGDRTADHYELIKMGFDVHAVYIPNLQGTIFVFQFGNIELREISTNKYSLTSIQNKQSHE